MPGSCGPGGGGEISPYSAQFREAYAAIFGAGPDSHFWVYPPWWWPIALPISLLPFSVAGFVWKLSSVLLIVGATHLTARMLDRNYWPVMLAGLAYAFLMQATAVSVYLGQTAALVYFGLAAVGYGLAKDRVPWVVVGLAILALKPHVAVPIGAALMLTRYRWAGLATGTAMLLLSVPFLDLSGFVRNLGLYNTPSVNSPPNLTGLIHFVPVNSVVALLLATVAASLAIKRDWALVLASLAFFLPLHSYDLVFLAALPMALLAKRSLNVIAICGMLICLRSGNLASIAGIKGGEVFPDSLLMSIGLALILIGAATEAVPWRKIVRSTPQALN